MKIVKNNSDLSVGQLAHRSGVSVSTLHYYEAEDLIFGWRNAGNHRRYSRDMLRRIAVIKVAQSVGLSLSEIKSAIDVFPKDKKLNASDWHQISSGWNDLIEERIRKLTLLKDQLNDCIGCGCLSLEKCPLYNPKDELGKNGPGARRWTADPT
ncbi:redox-sensitive transcriptional activator SoxR [Parasulfitobacter algicola]|uniref:Redox-sensitive transcriptional activator SoxR n=1 Tax=Parasulfitobacter algicola TaxID=2614809 RepID=A0ABX2ISB6_9RHOB|nr:redox-sensitive transcriptional activator SoxR [Sulfitobacter algicola]NSX54911.1 redox-sensitive transcriptional activator SoxR [Sulfitobacter algicola]